MAKKRAVIQYIVSDGNIEGSQVQIQLVEGRTPDELACEFQTALAQAAYAQQPEFTFLEGHYDTREYYEEDYGSPRHHQPKYPLFKTLDDYFEEYKTVR